MYFIAYVAFYFYKQRSKKPTSEHSSTVNPLNLHRRTFVMFFITLREIVLGNVSVSHM